MSAAAHPAVELAASLVRLPTEGRAETRAADLLAPRLSALGFTIHRHQLAPDRDNLVATRPGPPALALSGHLDTVPATAQDWARDPWAGEISDGALHGRGAADMKSGVAAIVVALEQAAAAGADLRGVSVLFTVGEETGCEGAASLAAAGVLPPAAALLIAEPTSVAPLLGHKGIVWSRLTARGVAAHGSTPERGVNAIVPIAEAVTALDRLDLATHHPLLGSATVSPNRIAGGAAVNIIPDHAHAEIDVRLVPGLTPEQALAALRAAVPASVEVTPTTLLEPVASDPDTPLYRAARAAADELGAPRPEPAAATFFTDASVLARALDVPAVICGPGEAAQAHRVDEHCPLTQIEAAVELYRGLLLGRVVG